MQRSELGDLSPLGNEEIHVLGQGLLGHIWGQRVGEKHNVLWKLNVRVSVLGDLRLEGLTHHIGD